MGNLQTKEMTNIHRENKTVLQLSKTTRTPQREDFQILTFSTTYMISVVNPPPT